MTTLPRHRTAGEKRAQASALAALDRALAHTRPPDPPHPGDVYVTPAVARQIRHELEETHRHG